MEPCVIVKNLTGVLSKTKKAKFWLDLYFYIFIGKLHVFQSESKCDGDCGRQIVNRFNLCCKDLHSWRWHRKSWVILMESSQDCRQTLTINYSTVFFLAFLFQVNASIRMFDKFIFSHVRFFFFLL